MTSYWNHNTAYHRELVNAVPVRRPAPAAGDALDPNGVNDAASHRGPVTVLDIGCGDGLLVERLLATGATVTGIDADAAAVVQASRRLGLPCRLGAPGPACSTPPGPMSISDPFSGTPADPAEASSPLDPVQTDRRTAGGPKATILHGDALTVPELDGQSFYLITCVAALHHMPLEPALLRMRELLAPGGRLRIVGLAANASAVDWIVSAALLVPVRLASAIHRESRDIGVPTSHPRESLREIRAAVARLLPGCRIRRRFYYRYTIAWDKPRAQPEPQNRPDP